MIAVIRVIDGSYNIFATHANGFALEGNITKEMLLELKEEVDREVADILSASKKSKAKKAMKNA